MESTSSNEILIYVVIGLSVMLLIIGVIIAYVIISRKRYTMQLDKMHEMKAAHQKSLFSSMVKAQEIERQKISKNLHDEIGTTLSAGKILIAQIERSTEGSVNSMASKVKEILDNTINETRRVINDLSPNSLQKFGLFAELEKLSKFSMEVGNIIVNTKFDDFNERFNSEIEITLYRIIKEFINNTLKYAQASNINIIFSKQESNLMINIEDDGKGFEYNEDGENGYGIKNMKSRVFLLNGQSEYKSKIGIGTELNIVIPLPK